GVERRVASQRELAAHVRTRLSGREGRIGMFEISERDVPEQLVLTEQRHVRVDELPSWIGTAAGRLMESAQAYGGVAGPRLRIYHGEVSEDGDGPVEVCVPVDPAQEVGDDAPARREPAHREAYTRLIKAQVEYPQILSAYDAVAQWIGKNDRTGGGS